MLMSASKSQRSRRAVLGEDGEIQDLDSLLNDSAAPEASPEHEAAPTRVPQGESIYCVRCGTANVYDASYCARCGKALVEPGVPAAAHSASGDREAVRKTKRDWQPVIDLDAMPGPRFARQRQLNSAAGEFNIWAMISRIVMLTFMTGMVISSVAIHGGSNAWIGVLALVAWFLVEAVQSGKRHLATMVSMITEVVTMTFVSGIVIAAIAVSGGSNAWLGLIALVAWFLVEAVRS